MPQTKLKLKKSGSLQLALTLVCLSACVTPEPPNINVCTVDLPRDRLICFESVSGVGPTFVLIDDADKWTAVSPESKRLLDNYMKDIKRKLQQCSK